MPNYVRLSTTEESNLNITFESNGVAINVTGLSTDVSLRPSGITFASYIQGGASGAVGVTFGAGTLSTLQTDLYDGVITLEGYNPVYLPFFVIDNDEVSASYTNSSTIDMGTGEFDILSVSPSDYVSSWNELDGAVNFDSYVSSLNGNTGAVEQLGYDINNTNVTTIFDDLQGSEPFSSSLLDFRSTYYPNVISNDGPDEYGASKLLISAAHNDSCIGFIFPKLIPNSPILNSEAMVECRVKVKELSLNTTSNFFMCLYWSDNTQDSTSTNMGPVTSDIAKCGIYATDSIGFWKTYDYDVAGVSGAITDYASSKLYDEDAWIRLAIYYTYNGTTWDIKIYADGNLLKIINMSTGTGSPICVIGMANDGTSTSGNYFYADYNISQYTRSAVTYVDIEDI